MTEKELATEMLMSTGQVKSSKYLRLNFYVVLHPATRSSRSRFFKIGVLKNFAKLTCEPQACNYVKDTLNPSQLFIFTNIIRCFRLPL